MKTSSLLGMICISACLATGSRSAENPARGAPASPRSVPGDDLPPARMLDDSGHLIPVPALLPGTVHPGHGSAPESTARGPSLELAIAAARAAVRACGTAGYRVGVAVIDSVGEARAMLTADGSDGSHVFVGMRKALTALEFQMPSAQAAERVEKDPAYLARVKPYMFVMGGALPIKVGQTFVGAIGVSGAGGVPFGHQDELCAAAGLQAIQGKLK